MPYECYFLRRIDDAPLSEADVRARLRSIRHCDETGAYHNPITGVRANFEWTLSGEVDAQGQVTFNGHGRIGDELPDFRAPDGDRLVPTPLEVYIPLRVPSYTGLEIAPIIESLLDDLDCFGFDPGPQAPTPNPGRFESGALFNAYDGSNQTAVLIALDRGVLREHVAVDRDELHAWWHYVMQMARDEGHDNDPEFPRVRFVHPRWRFEQDVARSPLSLVRARPNVPTLLPVLARIVTIETEGEGEPVAFDIKQVIEASLDRCVVREEPVGHAVFPKGLPTVSELEAAGVPAVAISGGVDELVPIDPELFLDAQYLADDGEDLLVHRARADEEE